MIQFPSCKINLGLNVRAKRADGYHDLETVFFPVPFTDILEVVPAPVETAFSLSVSGLAINGNPADNLCAKAYRLLKADFPALPNVVAHLHKVIPMGAGLGGGSSDGAFMLSLLNELFDLHLTEEVLIRYAASLGSDCPFFILNKPCSAVGRGEILTPVDLDLSGYNLVLVHPHIHVNTGWAFSELASHARPARDISGIAMQPMDTWKDLLVNDFEGPVFARYPAIGTIKEELYRQGAVYAAMSGSGSTVFGLFPVDAVLLATPFPDYLVHTVVLGNGMQ